MYDNLFSPIKINSLEIKNRIVFPALGLLFSLDGKLNERHLHFYTERARGGTGIVTVGPVGVGEMAVGIASPGLDSDDAIPAFTELATSVRKAGARAWLQLYHGGRYVRPIQIGGEKAVAPSAVYSSYTKATPRELTIDEIHRVQEAFVRTAERAREAGFDGVEIIGSAGYLVTQFLSPLTNLRKDEYGGSFENRTRFVREMIASMRARLGTGYPITVRMAGNDFVPGSNTDRETPAFARMYEEAGIDALNVTGGWHEARVPQMAMELPRGGFAYLARTIKDAVSIPVMASNRITDPDTAERILRDDMAHMVNLGRVLLADPYWPEKAQSGRVREIIPCISCLQGCMDELFEVRHVRCLVNARTSFEGERRIVKTKTPRRVMVVGAGPGGLEAAMRAAEAGHRVELFDRAGRTGGQLWIAGMPPHKREIWELVKYYDTMLGKHGVEVNLGAEVGIDLIKERKPDYVIIAEGAEPLMPPIEGIQAPPVLTAWDVLKNDPKIGRRVAVIGGGAVGMETALFLAVKGTITDEGLGFLFRYEAADAARLKELVFRGTKEVTIFEMLPRAGKGVGKSSIWILMENLRKYGVKLVTGAKVISVSDGTVEFEREGVLQSLEFDAVVNAAGSRPVKKLADAVAKAGIPHAVVGDGKKIGQIMDAIHDGYLAVTEMESRAEAHSR
ncbi:MAG: FAD-dependent oxidoreductase [Spirochaetes bacterium]|nr:MAG: FAD-dependent oxidoreductase [Spirochaetota bacterium]